MILNEEARQAPTLRRAETPAVADAANCDDDPRSARREAAERPAERARVRGSGSSGPGRVEPIHRGPSPELRTRLMRARLRAFAAKQTRGSNPRELQFPRVDRREEGPDTPVGRSRSGKPEAAAALNANGISGPGRRRPSHTHAGSGPRRSLAPLHAAATGNSLPRAAQSSRQGWFRSSISLTALDSAVHRTCIVLTQALTRLHYFRG
jgi:hypothetical protein